MPFSKWRSLPTYSAVSLLFIFLLTPLSSWALYDEITYQKKYIKCDGCNESTLISKAKSHAESVLCSYPTLDKVLLIDVIRDSTKGLHFTTWKTSNSKYKYIYRFNKLANSGDVKIKPVTIATGNISCGNNDGGGGGPGDLGCGPGTDVMCQ